MHPDDVLAGLRDGSFTAGPTDKNYKMYVNRPATLAQQVALRGELETQALQLPFAGECDEEQRAIGRQQWVDNSMLSMGDVGESVGKFYFEHLNDEHRTEFIQLINDGEMKIGYPGYFYQLPFFCRVDQ